VAGQNIAVTKTRDGSNHNLPTPTKTMFKLVCAALALSAIVLPEVHAFAAGCIVKVGVFFVRWLCYLLGVS
jgi:hypothetical protein